MLEGSFGFFLEGRVKMVRDYYNILGVERSATSEAIKKAYRVLAKKFHPDVAGDDAGAKKRFEEIKKAYEILGDEAARKEYDTKGHQQEDPIRQKTSDGRETAPDFSGAFGQFFGFKPDQKEAKFDESAPMKTDELFQSFFKPKRKDRS